MAWKRSESHGYYPFVEPSKSFLLHGLSNDVSDADVFLSLKSVEELVLLKSGPDRRERIENHAGEESAPSTKQSNLNVPQRSMVGNFCLIPLFLGQIPPGQTQSKTPFSLLPDQIADSRIRRELDGAVESEGQAQSETSVKSSETMVFVDFLN